MILHILRTAVRELQISLSDSNTMRILVECHVPQVYNSLPTTGNMLRGKPVSPARIAQRNVTPIDPSFALGAPVYVKLPAREHKLAQNFAKATVVATDHFNPNKIYLLSGTKRLLESQRRLVKPNHTQDSAKTDDVDEPFPENKEGEPSDEELGQELETEDETTHSSSNSESGSSAEEEEKRSTPKPEDLVVKEKPGDSESSDTDSSKESETNTSFLKQPTVKDLKPSTLIIFIQKNPKMKGTKSHERYEGYKKSKTVAEARRLGASAGDLGWDLNKGYLRIADKAHASWELNEDLDELLDAFRASWDSLESSQVEL